jgi:hypothetical protein
MLAAQIFLSYARDDDKLPAVATARRGFVEALADHVACEFTGRGPFRPSIWRDREEVGCAEQFDEKIERAIRASVLFVVVLSDNWLASEYCRKELEIFARCARAKGLTADEVRKRITVVGKRHVPVEQRPPLLQGQQSFEFYSTERRAGNFEEREFFKNGELRDPKYYDRVEELAAHLWREASRLSSGQECLIPQLGTALVRSQLHFSNRTIYLAKPASDMVESYDRLTIELQHRGYKVVPGRDDEIPHDPSALGFIDACLAEAEMSIHLLGDKMGRCPEDLPPIAKLQLERAARLVSSEESGRFHRLIWAPRRLKQTSEVAEETGERDPLEVLAKFHRQLGGDRVSGDALSRFVDFVAQHLMRETPPIETAPQIPAESSVYVYHSLDDEEYAIALKAALEERNVEAELPAFGGSDSELRNFHLKKLVECDAVALCWAHASEVWVRSCTDELKNWRALGRKHPFVFRGVVAGPPPDKRKKNMKSLFPRSAIDLVVDLEDKDLPLPELLDSLIPKTNLRGATNDEPAAVSRITSI